MFRGGVRPRPRFINYANIYRESVRAQHPNLEPGQLAWILTAQFNAMSEEEKERFTDAAIFARQIERAKEAQKQVLDEYK